LTRTSCLVHENVECPFDRCGVCLYSKRESRRAWADWHLKREVLKGGRALVALALCEGGEHPRLSTTMATTTMAGCNHQSRHQSPASIIIDPRYALPDLEVTEVRPEYYRPQGEHARPGHRCPHSSAANSDQSAHCSTGKSSSGYTSLAT
jgi:hypothetical protein